MLSGNDSHAKFVFQVFYRCTDKPLVMKTLQLTLLTTFIEKPKNFHCIFRRVIILYVQNKVPMFVGKLADGGEGRGILTDGGGWISA